MTWLIIEDFMEEVSFKLGQGLDFTVGDSCGVGKGIQAQQNDLSTRTVICIEESVWFNLAKVLHML